MNSRKNTMNCINGKNKSHKLNVAKQHGLECVCDLFYGAWYVLHLCLSQVSKSESKPSKKSRTCDGRHWKVGHRKWFNFSFCSSQYVSATATTRKLLHNARILYVHGCCRFLVHIMLYFLLGQSVSMQRHSNKEHTTSITPRKRRPTDYDDDDERNRNFHYDGLGFKLEIKKISFTIGAYFPLCSSFLSAAFGITVFNYYARFGMLLQLRNRYVFFYSFFSTSSSHSFSLSAQSQNEPKK